MGRVQYPEISRIIPYSILRAMRRKPAIGVAGLATMSNVVDGRFHARDQLRSCPELGGVQDLADLANLANLAIGHSLGDDEMV